MNRLSFALALSILMTSIPAAVFGQVYAASTESLEGIPHGWLNEFSTEVDSQVERFAAAYNMGDQAKEQLRQTLVSRLAAQWQFESKGFQEVQKKIDEAQARGIDLEADTEEARAIQKDIETLGTIGPLNDLVIASELEANMDPVVAEQGRVRLTELISRRDQITLAQDDDFETQSGHNVSLAEARMAGSPPVTAAGNPLPNGAKLAEVAPAAVGKPGGETPPSIPVRPNAAMHPGLSDVGIVPSAGAATAHAATGADMDQVRAAADALLNDPTKSIADVKGAATNGRTAKAAARKIGAANAAKPAATAAAPVAAVRDDANRAEKNPGPSRPMPAAVEPVRLQAAPALDDWDKYVDTTCKKFEFTDAQVIKAQSILKDLRNRARAYRNSRDDDFAAAERLTDAKAKADRKKELNTPIDAFFEELKQRLDNLATLEQRAKAAAPAAGKK